jgi:hypothetical protein
VLLGRQLIVTKEGVVSKVMVSVEERKLPDKAHKLTAEKGIKEIVASVFLSLTVRSSWGRRVDSQSSSGCVRSSGLLGGRPIRAE